MQIPLPYRVRDGVMLKKEVEARSPLGNLSLLFFISRFAISKISLGSWLGAKPAWFGVTLGASAPAGWPCTTSSGARIRPVSRPRPDAADVLIV